MLVTHCHSHERANRFTAWAVHRIADLAPPAPAADKDISSRESA
jgi:hypothetical protein